MTPDLWRAASGPARIVVAFYGAVRESVNCAGPEAEG